MLHLQDKSLDMYRHIRSYDIDIILIYMKNIDLVVQNMPYKRNHKPHIQRRVLSQFHLGNFGNIFDRSKST